jgi:hypothetical protein
MSSFAKYAGEHYLEFHRFSADVGGSKRIGLFDHAVLEWRRKQRADRATEPSGG